MNFKNNSKSLVECKNIVIKFENALILGSHWYTGSMPTLTLLASGTSNKENYCHIFYNRCTNSFYKCQMHS